MQQLFTEERIRTDGCSGVKAKRHRNEGTRPYHSDTYTGMAFLNLHDHANHRHTVGMGEFVAVLNGVEFRTRHNDYGLYMPSTKTTDYNAVDEIELPDVPPKVLALEGNIAAQEDEMRKWFKAFHELDRSERDYRKYFKPVLCYLEGAWTHTDPENTIEEPFKSDRHSIMAIDWIELHRKIRFTSYTGSKNNGENLAFLPTAIVDMFNDTEPIFGQWNYRIMCHPLKNYLETDRLRVVDDLAPRVAFTRTLESFRNSRSARFQLHYDNKNVFEEGHTYFTHLHKLMSEIPGKDNYAGKKLEDDAFGAQSMDFNNHKQKLNTGHYHNWYLAKGQTANGRPHVHRGFSDTNVFMAQNTRPEIVPQTVNDECKRDRNNVKNCLHTYKQRWSYAIPLEIVYLTPLGKWNPYNIEYREVNPPENSKRNGKKDKSLAYEYAAPKYFYRTPKAFFTGSEDGADAADTSGKSVWMLDKNGNLRNCMASGVYSFMPEIEGVGRVRTRYPIAPVHQEGSALWKEFQALRDLVLLQEDRMKRLREEFGLGTNPNFPAAGLGGHDVTMEMAKVRINGVTHTHTVNFVPNKMNKMHAGGVVELDSNESEGHIHRLRVKYEKNDGEPTYKIIRCDRGDECKNHHHDYLLKVI